MKSSTISSSIPFLLLAAWFLTTDAYPGGPPLSACISMVPTGHGASTLSGTTPFLITTNTTFYTPEEQIEVTISGARFVGFFVQARRRDASSDTSHVAVGTMTPGDTVIGKTLDCSGGISNAWSHRTNAAKTSESAIWTAPSDDQGVIAFRATIVQGPSSDRYWTNVYSANLPFGSPPTENTDVIVTPTPTSNADVPGPSLLLLLVSAIAVTLKTL